MLLGLATINPSKQNRENKMTHIVYFDMDGTIADYEKRFIEIWGADLFKKFQTMTKEEKRPYQEKMSLQGFYRELQPLEPMFTRMWTLFKAGVDVRILTSVGKINSTAVAVQKNDWLKAHCPADLYEHLNCGERFVWVTSSKAKSIYANKNTTLVDDREKAWRPFLQNGGSVVVV